MPMNYETTLLYLACGCYSLGFVCAYLGRESFAYRRVIFFTVAGLLCHSVNLGLRWERVGHAGASMRRTASPIMAWSSTSNTVIR